MTAVTAKDANFGLHERQPPRNDDHGGNRLEKISSTSSQNPQVSISM